MLILLNKNFLGAPQTDILKLHFIENSILRKVGHIMCIINMYPKDEDKLNVNR